MADNFDELDDFEFDDFALEEEDSDSSTPPADDDFAADDDFDATDLAIDDDDFGSDEDSAADELAEEVEDADEPDSVADIADEEVRPKVTMTTMVMCVLNVVVASLFAFLLLMDFGKRQGWSYAVFLHDFALRGIPLQEADKNMPAAQVARPNVKITPEEGKANFLARRTGGRVKEPFRTVDERLNQPWIKPSQLSKKVLRDVFRGGGPPVRTLEAEVARVKRTLFTDVATAAQETSKKLNSVAAKQGRLKRLLLPMLITTEQLVKINSQIENTNDNATLDKMLVDAAQRRLFVDLLVLLQNYAPIKEHAKTMDNVGDPGLVLLDKLKTMVTERFEVAVAPAPHTSFEKRATIGLLLVAVAHVKKPDSIEPLYPDAKERATIVLGLLDYNRAVKNLTDSVGRFHRYFAKRIAEERDGKVMLVQGQTVVIDGYVVKHEALVASIKSLLADIKSREQQLRVLQVKLTELQASTKKRQADRDKIVQEILNLRQETGKLVAEQKRLEKQLFDAQLELADASLRNQRLEREIRQGERTLLGD